MIFSHVKLSHNNTGLCLKIQERVEYLETLPSVIFQRAIGTKHKCQNLAPQCSLAIQFLYMANNPVVKNFFEAANEAGNTLGREAKAVGSDFIKQLYGTTNLTNGQIEQKEHADQTRSKQDIASISDELRLHAGQYPQEAIDATIDNSKQNEVLQKRQMFSAAQSLGVTHIDTAEQERQQKEQLEKQEEARKKAEAQQRLGTAIEAPHGREIGVPSFASKRRRTPPRMQPPKSSESRAGRGIGG